MAKQDYLRRRGQKSAQTGIDKLSTQLKSPWVPKAATWFWTKNSVLR